MASRMRVAEHRRKKEEQGYRLLQVWVPDHTNQKFMSELKSEYLSIRRADSKDDVLDWIEELSAGVWDDE